MTTDQRHERNDPDESNGDRYIYLYDVPSLQEIASHEIVREIWNRNLSTYHPIKGEEMNVIPCSKFLEYCDEYGCQQQQAREMITHLKVPRRVEEKLKNSLEKLCKEITRWVAHLLRIVFRHKCLRGSHEIRGIDPKWCIWSMRDEIDYEKSVRKILEIGNLTDLQKFLIMCEYCMEDEIEKFSLDLLPSEFIEKVTFSTNNSCFYWICFLKNDLHKMPVENPLLAGIREGKEIYTNCRFSTKFFWDRLSDDDQVKVAVGWIRHELGVDTTFLQQLLSEMSWYQQQCLLSDLSETFQNIIIRFAIRPRSSQITLWIWKHFKNEISLEQFPKFFCDVIICDTSTFMLLEMWETASDHQRNSLILNMSEEFINSYIIGQGFVNSALKNEMWITRRNLMLQKTTQDDMPWHDSYLLNNILDNSSPCSDDILKLIKLGIDSTRFGTHLHNIFHHQNFEMFDDELKAYFLHDVDAARAYKRLFLEEVYLRFVVGLGIFTNVNFWDEFCNFIEDAFENDVARALRVKRRLITENVHFSLDPQSYFDLRRGYDNLVKIVEEVFRNNKLRRVKYYFSRSFRYLESTRSFVHIDEKFNLKFEQWCSVASNYSIWSGSDSNYEFLFYDYDESTSDED
ncbi:uncharacterized protein LOC135843540 [Planococcus citri]|uniref:uncharacterized protein LOC135843540 n=1 Tax=Planococcus citri TaxID=170843 RepID=UPI0031F832A3